MSRIEEFKKLQNHPWLKRSYEKLKENELKIALDFLEKTQNDNNDDFAFKAVRIFLNCENKPKHWKEIEELLICSMSADRKKNDTKKIYSHLAWKKRTT